MIQDYASSNNIPFSDEPNQEEGLGEVDIIRIFDELRSKAEPLTARHRLQARINENFVNGNQWFDYTTKNDRVYIENIAPGDTPQISKPVLNNLALTWTALLTKDRPSVYAVGQGDSIQDKSAAEIATKLIEYLEQDLDIDQMISKTVYNGCYSGTSAIKVAYVDDKSNHKNGQLYLELLPIQEYLLDPQVQNAYDSKWMILKKWIPESVADDIFMAHNVPGSPNTEFYFDGHDQRREGVADYELWYRPCRKYPKGFFAHIIDQQVIEYIPEYPYSFTNAKTGQIENLLPAVFFFCKEVRGSSYGRTFITDTVQLQAKENELISKLYKLWKQTSTVHRILPKALQDSIDDENSIIFFDDPSMAEQIKFTDPPQPSPLFNEMIEFFERAIYDVAGVSETTTGQQNNETQSGKAIKFQAELDNQKTQDSIKSLQNMITKLYDLLLKIVQKFWTVPQLLNIFDDERMLSETIQFDAADIQGVDVRLQPRSGRDLLQTSKEQDALERLQQGLISPSKADSLVGSIGSLIAKQQANELIDTYLSTGSVDISPGTIDMEILLQTIQERQQAAILSADASTHEKLEILKIGAVKEAMAAQAGPTSSAPEVAPATDVSQPTNPLDTVQ